MRTTISTSIMTWIALAALPAPAAEVTYERLLKPEPQNWLMNHHDLGAQRYSALDTINRSNPRNLKLAIATALAASNTSLSLRACAALAPRLGNTATRECGFHARQNCARSATLERSGTPSIQLELEHFQRAVMPVMARPTCDKPAALAGKHFGRMQ
jgi:hypothetical protein